MSNPDLEAYLFCKACAEITAQLGRELTDAERALALQLTKDFVIEKEKYANTILPTE